MSLHSEYIYFHTLLLYFCRIFDFNEIFLQWANATFSGVNELNTSTTAANARALRL